MFLNDLLRQFGIAKIEKMMAVIFGFVTLTQVHTIVGILIVLAGGIVSVVFAVRKHLKKERSEKELHIIRVIKDLQESGLIEPEMTFQEKRAIALEHIEFVK